MIELLKRFKGIKVIEGDIVDTKDNTVSKPSDFGGVADGEVKTARYQTVKTKKIPFKDFIQFKEVLTLDEASAYLGVSKSFLYKMTAEKSIPHYKPFGKVCYYKKTELEEWITRQDAKISDTKY